MLRAQAAAALGEAKERERRLKEALTKADAMWAALPKDQREALVAEAALRLAAEGQALFEGFSNPAAEPLRSLFDPCTTQHKSLAFSYRAFFEAAAAALNRETENLKALAERYQAAPSLTLYEAYRWSLARGRLLVKLVDVVRLRMELHDLNIALYCGWFLAVLPTGRAPEYWAEAGAGLSQTGRLAQESVMLLNEILVRIVDLGR